MKKSIVIRMACLLLAVAIISPVSSAFAANADNAQSDSIEILRYSDTKYINAALSIDTNGKATCSGAAKANSSGNTVELEMHLKYGNTDVKDWSTSGTGSASLNKTWYVTSGHSYYVMVYAYIYDSNGNLLESSSTASNLVTF